MKTPHVTQLPAFDCLISQTPFTCTQNREDINTLPAGSLVHASLDALYHLSYNYLYTC